MSGSGRSPGEGNSNPFQYSYLENSRDRGAWGATVHEIAKSWTWLSTHSVKNMLISKKIGNYWRFRTGVTAWTLCFKLIQKGLECEGRWALGSIATNKASGGDGIPAELFQILKDDAIKVLHSICQQIWKAQQITGLEKVSFHSKAKEGQC